MTHATLPKVDVYPRVANALWLLGYLAAWLPVTAMYFVGFAARPGGSMVTAAWYAAASCALAAALASVMWPLAGRVQSSSAPRWRVRWSAVVTVVLLSATHSAVWGLGLRLSGVDTATVQDAVMWDAFGGLWLFSLVFVTMVMVHSMRSAREQTIALRTAISDAHRADALRAEAELRAIRAHVNPHFLFNALNAIAAVVERDPPTARTMLVRTGTLLRRVLDIGGRADCLVTIADEWQLVRDYLDIEQLRMQDRLNVRADLSEDALECLVPALTLQPLVENAIRHGIFPKLGAGTLEITAVVREQQLQIRVSDDGVGVSSESTSQIGIGQRAVLERMQTAYGTQATMHVVHAVDGGYCVELMMPAMTGES